MSVDRTRGAIGWAVLLVSAAALGGCSTSLADLPIGTPSDAPAHARDSDGYLPVNDLPPGRAEPELAPAEQAKIEAELLGARDRQAAANAAKTTTAK